MESKQKKWTCKKLVLIGLAIYYLIVMLVSFVYTLLPDRKYAVHQLKQIEQKLSHYSFLQEYRSILDPRNVSHYVKTLDSQLKSATDHLSEQDGTVRKGTLNGVNMSKTPGGHFIGEQKDIKVKSNTPKPSAHHVSAQMNSTTLKGSRFKTGGIKRLRHDPGLNRDDSKIDSPPESKDIDTYTHAYTEDIATAKSQIYHQNLSNPVSAVNKNELAKATGKRHPVSVKAPSLQKDLTQNRPPPKKKPPQGKIPLKKKITPKKKPDPKPATTIDPKVLQEREAMARQKSIDAYLKSHESMCLSDWADRTLATGMKPLCNCTPSTIKGYWPVDKKPVPLNKTIAKNVDVMGGGHWEPKDCTARYKIVVIIPFRDRHEHLSVLLHHLHPKLQGQQLNYTIIVVEQNEPEIFNKASLMNVGFKYAMEEHQPDCVIFHDVDMIPEDGRHFYTCRDNPLHLGAHHTRHKYRVIYSYIFGGVTSFRPAVFQKINGFSNRFFGWGGEDDDMSARVRENKFRILREPRAMSGYTALVHPRDKGNVQKDRGAVVKKAFYDRDTRYDGLNSLRFVFQKRRLYPLYTWLLVDILNDDTKIGFDVNSG